MQAAHCVPHLDGVAMFEIGLESSMQSLQKQNYACELKIMKKGNQHTMYVNYALFKSAWVTIQTLNRYGYLLTNSAQF